MYRTIRIFAFSCLMLLFQGMVHGQRTVKGVITDTEGIPLIGASILEQGTSNGTVSALDGSYTIAVAGENAVLVFSYVGLKTISRTVGAEAVINMMLEEEAGVLGEIVVTALGLRENKDAL